MYTSFPLTIFLSALFVPFSLLGSMVFFRHHFAFFSVGSFNSAERVATNASTVASTRESFVMVISSVVLPFIFSDKREKKNEPTNEKTLTQENRKHEKTRVDSQRRSIGINKLVLVHEVCCCLVHSIDAL